MTDNINTTPTNVSVIEPSFTFTPSVAFTFTAQDGVQQNSQSALVDQITTFTASTQMFDTTGRMSIVSYHWDFGDGTMGSGQTVSHTYIIPNFQAFTILRVTDNFGNVWSSRQQMYLTGLINPPDWAARNIEWASDTSTWASNA